MAKAMSVLAFTSALGVEHRDDLERLLFFNENQERASEGVTFVVERYGIPRIHLQDDRLRVGLRSDVPTQTLFAVMPTGNGVRPIGVVVYTREADALVVLFVAVEAQYASRGPRGDRMVLLQMIQAVQRVARCIRGIATVLVYMGRPTPTRITVRRDRPQ